MFGSGLATVIYPNEKMNCIMKIAQSLEKSDLLIQGFSEIIKNETKEQKGRFLNMLLGALSASLLGNLSAGKEMMRASEGAIRAGQDF